MVQINASRASDSTLRTLSFIFRFGNRTKSIRTILEIRIKYNFSRNFGRGIFRRLARRDFVVSQAEQSV